MRRESACDFVYSVGAEIGIVSVHSDGIIVSFDSLHHILLMRSIAFHKLGCKMAWRKANYTKRIPAEKWINDDLTRGVHILS